MATFTEQDRATILNLHAMASRGNVDEAARMADTALARGLVHPLILNLVALQRERDGRLEEARALLEQAVQLAPQDLSSANALGLLLMRLERPVAALPLFDRVIAIDPKTPFGHVNRGNALLVMGELNEADASYQVALEIHPQHQIALAGIAMLSSMRGDHERALSFGEAALQIDKQLPDAVISVAGALLAAGDAFAAHAKLKSLLSTDSLQTLDRSRAETLLADILDAQGTCDQAFALYTRANERLKAHYARNYTDDITALAYAEGLNDYIRRQRTPCKLTQPVDGPTAEHVFLIGFPRSGTTLLEMMLEGHPKVVSLEEKELLIDSVRAFMRTTDDLDRLANAADAELDEYRRRYWNAVAAAGVSVAGKVFVDKYPLNTLKWPVIARLFPKAKIVFCLRDPRDVVLSCFRRQFRMSAPMFEMLSLQGTARYYNAVMQLAEACRDHYPLETLVIRHEALVTDFEHTLESLCTFLNLPRHDEMARFAERARVRRSATPSTAQLARGLDAGTVGQWRRYSAELQPVLETLKPWVLKYHYPDASP